MVKNRTIVVASTNKGKVAEIITLIKKIPVTIRAIDTFPSIPKIEEDGLTFEENAYKKSSFTARIIGFPCIADDSGLVVPALGGAPGIYSARYAGNDASNLQRCNKLLRELKHHSDRRAYFKCVVSLAVPGGQALSYEGRCDGMISDRMIGDDGFGYDSVFFCNEFEKTFAQLTPSEKNLVSHRGNALKLMVEEFNYILTWLDLQMPVSPNRVCGYNKI